MSKKPDSFLMLLFFSCPFALFSLWIGFIAAFILCRGASDLIWDLCIYGIYYVGNAVFALFVGILAGFDIKKRFYAPILTTVCLLPTVVVFVYYTHFIDWFCIVTTLLVGICAMLISHLLIRKNKVNLHVETAVQ